MKTYKGYKTYNVGGWDRGVRYTIGLLFPVLALFPGKSRWARTAMWMIGLDGLLTAFFRFSPLNHLLGVSTYPRWKRLLPFAR